jgi:hypothetical protein
MTHDASRIGAGLIGAFVGFGSWLLLMAGLLWLFACLSLGGLPGDWSSFPLIMATLAVLGTLGIAVWLKSKHRNLLSAFALRRLLGIVLLLTAAIVLVPYPDAQEDQPLHLAAGVILLAGGVAVFLTWRVKRRNA